MVTYVLVGAIALALSQLDGGETRDRVLAALALVPLSLIVCHAIIS